jgi:hypothetical protein
MSCSSTQKIRFQLRRATEAEWISTDPVLLQGEPVVSTDTKQIKIGTGNKWSETDYINLAGGAGASGTPTTLTNLVRFTGATKAGASVNLASALAEPLALNQPVSFTAAIGNVIANKIYYSFEAYPVGASTIQIKTTPGGSVPY